MASPRPFDVGRLVREVASRLGPRVTLALDPNPAMVTAHEDRITRLLDLLISSQPGSLLVAVYPSPDHKRVCIEIQDENRVVPDLATARALIESYGGTLTAVPGTTTIELARSR